MALLPIGICAILLCALASTGAGAEILGTKSAESSASEAALMRGFHQALKHHGLPPGVPVPKWGEHAFFAPEPPEGALGGEGGSHGTNELGLREEEVPPMRYHEGGLVQVAPKVHVIFWGKKFEGSAAPLKTKLLSMYKGLAGSAYQGILTQYFNGGSYISQSVTVDSVVYGEEETAKEVNKKKIAEAIVFAKKELGLDPSKSNSEAQFDIITAPGSTYEEATLEEIEQAAKKGEVKEFFPGHYCAFHDLHNVGETKERDVYGFVPYEGDEPFVHGHNCIWYGNGNAENATSLMASHEYAESATDPIWDEKEKFGWQNAEGYEVADLCATPGDELANGSFVQGLYDDHENACSLGDEHPPHILASTEAATGVSKLGAVLHATINPEGKATTYQFEYGTSKAYGTKLPAVEASAGSGTANVEVQEPISGLSLETVYHYRVVAKNANGTTYGEDRTFIPSKWLIQSAPRETGWDENLLESVSCVSVNACEAVGHLYYKENEAVIYGWNGIKWSVQSPAVPTGGTALRLLGVSCSSATVCTAVGRVTIENQSTKVKEQWAVVEHWNGTQWTVESLIKPTGSLEAELIGVSCPSITTECVAVGSEKNASGVWVNMSARLQLGKWTVLKTPTEAGSTLSELSDVSCTGTAFCMGVGWYNTGSGTKSVSAVWNGSSWSLQGGERLWGLEGVSCTSASFCLAVGGHLIAETWDGSKWQETPAATFGDVEGGYFNSVSCLASNNCVAVGAGWGLLSAAPVTVAATWNGSTWKEQTTPRESELATSEITAVSCVALGACTSVGLSKNSGIWESLIESRPAELVSPTFASSFGSEGTGKGQLRWPTGIATDGNGHVWVADSANNRVEEFNEAGECIFEFGTYGSADGQFKEPLSIALASTGKIWVTDSGNDRVEEFSQEGKFLAKFGGEGTGPGKFSQAWGLAIAPDGHIWVSDALYYRVEEFTSTGTFVREAHGGGYGGTGDGELWHPTGLATDAKGDLWIADERNNRVQEFGPNGEFLTKFGSLGSGEGQFHEPDGIAVKPSGDILVTEYENNRVQELTPSGRYVTSYGTTGSGKEQLLHPMGIVLGPGGLEYVTDGRNGRVERWYQPALPESSLTAASNVTSSSATLSGTIYPGSLDTHYQVEYGTSTAYGSFTSSVAIGEGKEAVKVSVPLSGLASGTLYHARIVAINAGGTSRSKDFWFKTL